MSQFSQCQKQPRWQKNNKIQKSKKQCQTHVHGHTGLVPRGTKECKKEQQWLGLQKLVTCCFEPIKGLWSGIGPIRRLEWSINMEECSFVLANFFLSKKGSPRSTYLRGSWEYPWHHSHSFQCRDTPQMLSLAAHYTEPRRGSKWKIKRNPD